MSFHLNAKLNCYESNVTFAGSTIELSISDQHPEHDLIAITQETLKKVADAWPAIQANIIRSLHKTYNEAWADPEEGLPQLTAEEFIKRIPLVSIDVMEEQALGLNFADSGLFCGHWIRIFWDTDGKMYDANLEG